MDESFDLAAVPGHIQEQLAPHLAELNRPPAPPFRPSPGLGEQAAACQAASLLTVTGEEGQQRVFVHRWTATALAGRAAREPGQQLARAHRQAAAYWQWRVRAWPQDRAADVHDLLEARHHLLQAGDTEDAGQVTEMAVGQLHTWGAWDQEASLIHDTLARLPAGSPRQAAWIHQLGMLAQDRGDYDEAARQYQRALDINERIGDQPGVGGGYHQLGILAYLRGDYDQAARQYQRALDIRERIGNQPGMANSYGQLGILAQARGDYDEAARQYQRSLDIRERIGDQAGTARSYHGLGLIAQTRGDYDQAARQYQRSLDISERIGHQADTAPIYHQLGILAQDRGDYDQAARQYQRALDIFERLGDQAGMARSYHQLGILEKDRGGPAAAAITWHVKALAIRLRLGSPRRKSTCAAWPLTAPEPAPGPSPASWLTRPAAPTWLRQSQPCSTSWTRPTTRRPDRAGHSLTESARSNESRRAADVVITVVSPTPGWRRLGGDRFVWLSDRSQTLSSPILAV